MKRTISTLPVAQTFSLQDLVTIKKGGVSRQIIRSAKCNVTLFGFDAAQELSEHASLFDALVHVLEGELEGASLTNPIACKMVRSS